VRGLRRGGTVKAIARGCVAASRCTQGHGMPCPYPFGTGRSVCGSGLAHRRKRWAAGKMPAPRFCNEGRV
jgi:hypothetical protein